MKMFLALRFIAEKLPCWKIKRSGSEISSMFDIQSRACSGRFLSPFLHQDELYLVKQIHSKNNVQFEQTEKNVRRALTYTYSLLPTPYYLQTHTQLILCKDSFAQFSFHPSLSPLFPAEIIRPGSLGNLKIIYC